MKLNRLEFEKKKKKKLWLICHVKLRHKMELTKST